MSLEIRILPDYDAVSQLAADEIERLLRAKPDAVIGFATGETPRGLYRELRQRRPDCARVRTFNLDEYVGLSPDHPGSYSYYMHQELFDHLNFRAENVHLLNGDATDLAAECRAYEEAIARAGGIDLQVLGIGRNGHIGFNEPADAWTESVHVVTLAESTRVANAPAFGGDPAQVPAQAMTMGIRNIMAAGRLLLLATGATKADILAQALTGPVTPRVPASIVQQHASVLVLADAAAGEHLSRHARTVRQVCGTARGCGVFDQ